MAAAFRTSQALFLLTFFFSLTNITADQSPPNTGGTNFSCTVDSPSSCETYVAYFAKPPNYLDMENISHLFDHLSPSSIAKASNLDSAAGINNQLISRSALTCTHHLWLHRSPLFRQYNLPDQGRR